MHVAAGQHGAHAGLAFRVARVDVFQQGMGVRGAQDGRVQRARFDAEIIAVVTAPGEQGRIFDPLQGAAQERRLAHGIEQLPLVLHRFAPGARGNFAKSLAPRSNPASITFLQCAAVLGRLVKPARHRAAGMDERLDKRALG